MNPESPDQFQRAIADLDARLERISAEVAEMRSGLAALGRRTGQAAPPPPPPPPHPRPEPWAPPARPSGPWRPGPAPGVGPAPTAHPVGPPPTRPQPPALRPPRRRRPRVSAATVIAAIGGAVMLAGIAFLLIVAIQAGLFPPLARVIAAGVLAAVLVGLGIRLQARHEARHGDGPALNPGALALVGTGFAAAILDVIAATSLYHWVPVPAAYAFVGALAIAGMILAQRWSSALLACLLSAGTMALAPLISTGVELPVFVVVLAMATAVLGAELGAPVRLVWSVLPVPFLVGFLSEAEIHPRGEQVVLVAASIAFAAVGAGAAWSDAMRRTPPRANAALVVVPTAVPLLLVPAISMLDPGWPVALLLAAPYLALAYLAGWGPMRPAGGAHGGPEPALLSAVAGMVGGVLLLAAWTRLGDLDWTALAVTLTATAYMVAAGLLRRAWLDWTAGAAAALALVLYLAASEPVIALDGERAVRLFTATDVVASVAVTVLAVAATWWAGRRVPREPATAMTVGAVVALTTLSAAVVALGVVLGRLADDPRAGFLAAHLVVTVLWIGCAAWLVLARRTRVPESRRLGFVLGGLALAKLLLLDLATLPGLFRVLSFVVVGAVMLAVAVRYRSETDPSGSGSPT